jgi:hypothetical protein
MKLNLRELLTNLLNYENLNDDKRDELNKATALIEKINSENIFPREIEEVGEELWKYYTPEDFENTKDFSSEIASENYVNNLLKNIDIFKSGDRLEGDEYDYKYLIYIYLKFIYNNAVDYNEASMNIRILLTKIKSNPGYILNDADYSAIIPMNKTNPSYKLIKSNLIKLFAHGKFRNNLLSALSIQQIGPIVTPAKIIPNNSPTVNKISPKTPNKASEKVKTPLDFFIQPFTEKINGEKEINKKYEEAIKILKIHSLLKNGAEVLDGPKMRGVEGLAIVATNNNFALMQLGTGGKKVDDSAYKRYKKAVNFKDSQLTKVDVYENYLMNPDKTANYAPSEIKQSTGESINGLTDETLQKNLKRDEQILSSGFPPIITDLHCELFNSMERKDQNFLTDNYKKIKVTSEGGKDECLWLLKIDLSNFVDIFTNFNENEYAAKILEMYHFKTQMIEQAIADSAFDKNIQLEASSYLASFFGKEKYTSYHADLVKKYVNSQGVKFDYLEKLKIRGVADDDGNELTATELKEMYKSDIVDSSILDGFVTSLIPTSLLFHRRGNAAGGLTLNVKVKEEYPNAIIRNINENPEAFQVNSPPPINP